MFEAEITEQQRPTLERIVGHYRACVEEERLLANGRCVLVLRAGNPLHTPVE